MERNLFDEFDPVSAEAWQRQIKDGLAGRDYSGALMWESPEGISVKPFYHADDLAKFDLNASGGRLLWHIAQEIVVADSATANLKALDILQRGAESLMLKIPSEPVAIDRLLAGIDLERVAVHFDLRFLSAGCIENLKDFVGASLDNIHLNIDPIGHLARTGNWFLDGEKDFRMLGEMFARNGMHAIKNRMGIDATLYQNAGANIVEQLAYALAHANEYLNRFDGGSGSESIDIGKITFKIAIGSNYFFEIAKIRALRLLWSTLAPEYGASTECHIIATPSKRNKTLYAYNVNLLRSTTECMSAILGGADTVCNLPYDSVYHENNEFAERIARNQLLILKEESYFEGIEHPASGSYFIETLTRQLAEKALSLFKEIEAKGGFLDQLKNSTIQKNIKESADQEQRLFDTGEEILVGTNAYRNPENGMKADLERYPFAKTKQRKTTIEPIVERRLAETIEKERLHGEGWS